MNTELVKISEEIRDILEEKRQQLELSFVEETHTYFIKDENGIIRSDYPSVSKVLKSFYVPFDSEAMALKKSNGNKNKQKQLLNEWKIAGDKSTNLGSSVHYELEKYLINENNNYKEVRKPIFEIDDEQKIKSKNMINAGKDFLSLIKNRGAVHLDTELNLASNSLKYVGQCDNAWIINDNKNNLSFFLTDYKTNQPKNFVIKPYNGYLLPPFQNYRDYALTHYYLQIPLYGKLLIDMLKGTKYENIKMSGGIVVLLKDDGTFTEYRVPLDIRDTILNMDLKNKLK